MPNSMHDIVETFQDVAIQGYDTDRRVFYWNQASMALYGYAPEEAFGRRLEDLIIPAPMRDAVIREIDAWAAGGPPPIGGDLTLRHRDGGDIRVRSNHLALRDAAGRPSLFCIDIPLERQVELEAALNGLWPVDLPLSGGDGTPAGRTDVLGSLEQDVRTPLTAVTGFAELLARNVLSDDTALADALGGADGPRARGGLEWMVAQNLALMGAAPMVLDPHSSRVPVQDILVETAGMLMAVHADRDDLVSINTVGADLWAMTDSFLVKHALAALARFGIQNRAEPAPVVLSAHRRQSGLGGSGIVFQLEDTGPPLSDEMRLRAVSAHPLVKTSHRLRNGSALFYLSTAQRIALAIGASLSFDQTPAGTNRSILGVRAAAAPRPGR